jgi:NifU-like protein involved in Fe-S cluster formation
MAQDRLMDADTSLDLYDRRIRELAASVGEIGRLSDPDATTTAHSRLCGSRVTIDIKLADDVIAAYGHQVRACLIGEASAALFARLIVGRTIGQFRIGAAIMRRMLAEGVRPPDGAWQELEVLLPVASVRSRHGSALLPYDAVETALKEPRLPSVAPTESHRCGK